MDVIGVGRCGFVVVALLCVGGAVVLNSAAQFHSLWRAALTGGRCFAGAASASLARVTALLIAGRNAHRHGPPSGSMVVTEQVDRHAADSESIRFAGL